MERREGGVLQGPDVIVVGCGPAGSAAAAHLARAGVRVHILEKHRMPRYKTCGGGVVARALRWLPQEVSQGIEVTAHRACVGFLDERGAFELRDDAPLALLAMRDRLDAALAQEATRQGALLLEGHALETAERASWGWRLRTAREELHAPIVIAADGARSRMAQLAGWPQNGFCAPALEWEVEVDAETQRRYGSVLRFDFDAPQRGYAWVFPKREHLSVGILSTHPRARGLTAALERYLQLRGLRPRAVDKHAWMIPVAPRPQALAHDGVFLVGDAAGLVDPVTCEGITAALQSGDLVARCLLRAELDPRRAATLYQRALQADLLAELRWARRLARVLYGPGWVRRGLFRGFGPLLCEAMGSVIAGTQTYRSLLTRPAHLKRLLRPSRARAQRVDA